MHESPSPHPTLEDAAPVSDAPLAGRVIADPHLDGESSEREWWADPGLPWRSKPTRRDWACLGWVGFMGVFGLAMLPLRAWLLGLDPQWLLALTGGRTGAAATGAMARVGAAPWWPMALIAGSIMSIKFDWVFWWAGHLWGRGMIEVWAGQSRRAAKNYDRAERWANKLGWLGMFVAYIPIPLPLMQVIFVLFGSSGMSWRRFMILDFVASTLWLGCYFGLGYAVGEPVADLMSMYAKYANYVAIALVVIVVIGSLWTSSKKARSGTARD